MMWLLNLPFEWGDEWVNHLGSCWCVGDQSLSEGKIFVGGITAQTTREELLTFFSKVRLDACKHTHTYTYIPWCMHAFIHVYSHINMRVTTILNHATSQSLSTCRICFPSTWLQLMMTTVYYSSLLWLTIVHFDHDWLLFILIIIPLSLGKSRGWASPEITQLAETGASLSSPFSVCL